MTEVRPQAIVVMGVAGSGKSTVAALLAMMLRFEFQEGDLLHPPENVEKMRKGAPRTARSGSIAWPPQSTAGGLTARAA